MTLAEILDRLQGGRRTGDGYTAKCPAHEDSKPSLSVTESNGKILVCCHAGCTTEMICTALGITTRDLFLEQKAEPRIVATYDYVDEAGAPLFQVVRFDPKDFRQRRPGGKGGWTWNVRDVRRALYRLPEIVAAKSIIVAEGEKDVETARQLGFKATCNAGGAGKWRDEFSECLRGKRVAIISDADKAGREHAQQVATSLQSRATMVKVVELPDAKDLTEWVEKGGTEGQLSELIKSTPEWAPATPSTASSKPFASLFKTAYEIERETPAKVPWIGWCIPAGTIIEFDGKIKLAGKTTYATHFARAVLDGTPFMGQPTMRSPVVYLTEQPPNSWRQTLARAGILGRKDFHCLYFKDIRGLVWSVVANEAVAYCKSVGAKLLIVDTLSQFAGICEEQENHSGNALQAMGPLQVAAGDGLAVIVVRHERKSGGEVGDSARGSSAYGGAVDVILSIRRPEGNTRKSLRVIQAIGRFDDIPEETVVELTPDGYMPLGTVTDVATAEAEAAALEMMPTDPETAITLRELVEGTGKKRVTIQRALRKLKADGKIMEIGKGKKGDPRRYYIEPRDERIHSAQTTGVLGRNGSNGNGDGLPFGSPGLPDGPEAAENSFCPYSNRSLGRKNSPSSKNDDAPSLSLNNPLETPTDGNGAGVYEIHSAQTPNPIGAERNESSDGEMPYVDID